MSESVYQLQVNASDYFLGDWRLCARTNVLARGEIRIDLENRLVLLLIFFIEHQSEVLTKDRILKTIWQGKVVNDDSLAVAISHLRKALGDNSRSPEYIKTLPGVGYQFIARAGVVSPNDIETVSPLTTEVHSRLIAGKLTQQFKVNPSSLVWGLGLLVCIALVIFWRGWVWVQPQEVRSLSADFLPPELMPHQQAQWRKVQQQLTGWSDEDLKVAIQIARELLQQVPEFAPAFGAIAEAKIKLLQDQLGHKTHCAEVLGLLNKSLLLDSQQQAVLVMRGNVHFWCARNYFAAEQDYQRAMALNPSDAVAPMQYAQLFLAQQKFSDSLQLVDKSRQLNPLNYSVPTVVWIYQMQRRDDLALQELERINSAEPGDRYFHISAQRVYASLGREKESLQHWLLLMRESGYNDAEISAVTSVFDSGGLAAVNRWLLGRKDSVDLGQYTPPLSWARYALAAGEVEEALNYLEQAFALRQSPLLWGNVDPAYDPVRDHPRFQAIMAQLQQPELGLP